MMKKEKRERSSNFNPVEVSNLVDLVVKYSKIIENKRTDAVTWKEKEEGWRKLTEEYNCHNLTQRTVKSIKIKYEGLKKSLKRKKAHNRSELYKTGGGNSNSIPFTDYEERLLQVLSNLEGLAQVNDSDIVLGQEIVKPGNLINNEPLGLLMEQDTQQPIEIIEVFGTEATDLCEGGPSSSHITFQFPASTLLANQSDPVENSEEQKQNTPWSSWTPSSMKRPLTESLRVNKKRKMGKDSVSSKYSAVADSRQELLEIQMHNAKLDSEIKKKELELITIKIKHEEDQNEAKIKILNLQYKKLLEDNK